LFIGIPAKEIIIQKSVFRIDDREPAVVPLMFSVLMRSESANAQHQSSKAKTVIQISVFRIDDRANGCSNFINTLNTIYIFTSFTNRKYTVLILFLFV
jgi:hypothetical protein